MDYLILLLCSFFVLSNIYVEYKRVSLNPVKNTLSDYLLGPYSWIQDIGYISFSGTLLLLNLAMRTTIFETALLGISSIGVLLVVLTKLFQVGKGKQEISKLEKLHVFCAGVTFSVLTLFELLKSEGTNLVYFPVAVIVLAALYGLFKRTEIAILEKLCTIFLCSWVFFYFL